MLLCCDRCMLCVLCLNSGWLSSFLRWWICWLMVDCDRFMCLDVVVKLLDWVMVMKLCSSLGGNGCIVKFIELVLIIL